MTISSGDSGGSDPTGRGSDTKIRIRVALSDAYSMVKGLAHAVSLAQATPEQLMQERISELVGPSNNPRRPCRLDQIKNIRAELQAAIEQIRSMSPEELAFTTGEDAEASGITDESGTGEET